MSLTRGEIATVDFESRVKGVLTNPDSILEVVVRFQGVADPSIAVEVLPTGTVGFTTANFVVPINSDIGKYDVLMRVVINGNIQTAQINDAGYVKESSESIHEKLDMLLAGGAPEPGDPNVEKTFCVNDTNGIGIEGVEVCITTDSEGQTPVDSKNTNALGEVTFELLPGGYFVWRSKSGYRFKNPTALNIDSKEI